MMMLLLFWRARRKMNEPVCQSEEDKCTRNFHPQVEWTDLEEDPATPGSNQVTDNKTKNAHHQINEQMTGSPITDEVKEGAEKECNQEGKEEGGYGHSGVMEVLGW
jgi:hypothetical protein